MNDGSEQKAVPVDAKIKRRRFYIHLIIFAIAQITFFIMDGYSHWTIFNLNPIGEWVEVNLSHLWKWVQIYDYEMFNLLTVTWVIVLLIGGLVSFFHNFLSKRGKSLNS